MISGRKVLAKKQTVTAETLRRAQQALLDPGEGRRLPHVAKLPQGQEPKTLLEPLRGDRMDAGGLRLQRFRHDLRFGSRRGHRTCKAKAPKASVMTDLVEFSS